MYLSRLLSKILCWLKTNWFITPKYWKTKCKWTRSLLILLQQKKILPICLDLFTNVISNVYLSVATKFSYLLSGFFFNEVIHSVNARIDLKSSWNFFESFLCCNTLLAPHLPTHTLLRKRGFLVNGNVYSSLYEENNYP